jgi:enamine deaminase RidA (YjgF/YER057c/UK114 family)
MSAEQVLKERGIVLPECPAPKGNYVPGLVHNGILYLSGQGPLQENGEFAHGVVGAELTREQGYQHARLTGLVLLSAARQILGSLDRVEQVLTVFGMVNAVPGYKEQPSVINGCSDLFVEIFGEKGRHTRAAVGMGSLPLGISVELMATMAVRSA